MTTTPTPDPLSALAAELGRIGRRLDGMGGELLALRAAASRGERAAPDGAVSVAAATAVAPPAAAPPTALPPAVAPPTAAPPTAAGPAAAPPAAAVSPLPASAVGAVAPVPPFGGYAAPWPVPPAGLGPVGAAVPGWPGPGWAPAGPPAAGPPPAAWGPPAPAAQKRSPLTGARLLAWTGGAVTLLGVVLLLALAASRGWFTPAARVGFGAVLGAGLVGLGVWLHRREAARAGALALVATGFATLYLVDAAATAVYGFLPALPALLLALVVAGAGLGLADRWRTELLAGAVVVGAAVLAPAVTDGWLLAALVLVLQLAALLVVLRRRWAVLMLLAAVGPVLYGIRAVVVEQDVLAVVGVAAAVLVVALVTATLAVRRTPDRSTPAPATRGAGVPSAPPVTGGVGALSGAEAGASAATPIADTSSATDPGARGFAPAGVGPSTPGAEPHPSAGTTGWSSAPISEPDPSAGASGSTPGGEPHPFVGTNPRTWVGSIAAVVAAAGLPALAGAPILDGWRGALLAGGAAVVLALLAVLRSTPRPVQVAAGAASVIALLTATVAGLDGTGAVLAILGEALVAALIALGLRSRFAMVTALVLGGLGWLAAIQHDAPIATLVQFAVAPALPELVTAVAANALILALAAALLVAGGRLGWIRPDAARAALWAPIGLVGLYGAAGVVVNAALLISPTSLGFTAGHAVVTVSWAVAALILLARGLRRPALRVAGLVLVAAAVGKLVLFDLVALDGLARVGAFLGAGLVLLAAGTRYARLVAEAEQTPPSG